MKHFLSRMMAITTTALLASTVILPTTFAQTLSLPQSPPSATQVEKVTLQHRVAFEIAHDLTAAGKMPPGIEALTADSADNSLTVRGSAQAIALLKEEIAALDVAPHAYRVQTWIVQVRVDRGNVRTVRLPSMTFNTTDGVLARMDSATTDKGGVVTSGWSVAVRPRREPDGTLMLQATLGKLGPGTQTGTGERHTLLGKMVRLAGVTDSSDPRVREAVRQGLAAEKAKEQTAPYTAYFLDAMATEAEGDSPSSRG